jgi:hypothetical protein
MADEIKALVQDAESEAEELLEDEEELTTYEEMNAVIAADIQDAVDYLEEDLASSRETSIRFYNREPYGDEKDGRSQYISADVHDTVRGIMPDILRIFFGAEQAVEFLPSNAGQIQMAEQMTDYVNKVVMQQDNCGFLVAHSAFHDALLKDLGVIKWSWEETAATEVLQYSGLSPEMWSFLTMDESVQVLEAEEEPQGTIGGTIRRVSLGGKVKLDAVPPDEFLSDRDARTLEDARLVGHRTSKTASELMEMGLTWEEIEPHLGTGDDVKWNRERQARQKGASWPSQTGDGVDEATSPVLYSEVYRYFDYDGDGIAELRRFICLGRNYEVVRHDEWDEKPFALFGPDPRPHILIGGSVADLVKDIQLAKSRLGRAMFDSLGKSVDPKQIILDGQVNEKDVANAHLGSVIREYQQGAYRTDVTPFVGQQVLPVMQWMDQVKVQRTGNLDAGKALTADVLQSTTSQAVEMVHDNSKAQVEMIARIFAETGWKDLFKGILRTLVKHQDMERTVRLRGEYVPVNPKVWDAGMDVTINVALGAGTIEQRGQLMALLAQKQESVLQTMGLTNPLFTLHQYSNTLHRIAELGGIHDSDKFLQRVPADWTPPPPPEPEPDPSLIIAQAEMMKAQNEQSQLQVESSIDYQKALLTDNRERDRMQLEAFMKAMEIQTKAGTSIAVEEIRKIAQSKKD